MYYSNNFKLVYLIKKGKRLKLWVICQLCIPCQTNWRKWPTGQFSCSSLSLTTGWIMTPHLVRALYKSRFVDTWLGGDLSLLNQLKSNWFWHTNNPKYKKTRVYRVAVSKIWMYGNKTEIQFQWKLDAVLWGGAHHQIIISISTSLYNCLIIPALWVNFILFTTYIVIFKPLKKKWHLFHHFKRTGNLKSYDFENISIFPRREPLIADNLPWMEAKRGSWRPNWIFDQLFSQN